MQTFLPYADFTETALVLDRQRLGKQRVETMQIMRALKDPSYGWQNHPAVNMWRGYEDALMEYQAAIVYEWTSRGYRDTCLPKTMLIHGNQWYDQAEMPPWMGDEALHLSHRANLLRKDPEHYGPLFPGVDPTLPYVWPPVRMAA